MKTKLQLCITALVCLLTANCTQLYSQSTEGDDFRHFGAGISFQPLGIISLLSEAEGVPLTKFNFAFNLTKAFRAELDLGYYSRNIKSEDAKYSAFSAGVGFLGTKRIDSNVIMGGVKFDYTSGKAEYDNGSQPSVEDKFTRIALGPVLSYEHIFGSRFGIGGELGLKYSSYTQKPEDPDEDDYEANSFYTDAAIYLRIYF